MSIWELSTTIAACRNLAAGFLRSLTQLSSSFRTKRIARASSKGRTLFWTAVLSGMVALLIIVAVLQYRWTAQLSAATEVRIGSNLVSLMTGWHLDFYGELSAICVALQIGPDSGARDDWNDYLQRYLEWHRAATSRNSVENIHTNPDLVENVYLWETSQRMKPRLVRLSADTGKIEKSKVPQEMETLLARLQANSSSLSLALHAWEFTNPSAERRDDRFSPSQLPRRDAMTGWQFDVNIPAIVHPIIHHARHSTPLDTQPLVGQSAVDWIVVVLNLDTIQKRILPGLAHRYFASSARLDYRLAVIAAGNRPRLIYSSDSEFGSRDLAAADSTMNIFGPPPESTEGHFWQAVKNENSLKAEEWHNFSGPVWFPVIHYTSQQEPWVLMLQHRNGPLEAVATKVRWNNLITGSAVLLLLAANMSLVLIASHRTQKLAKLQMDFVASISHELRTPLAAILSAGENIRDGLVDGMGDLMLHGSIITRQVRQLIDLVDQILMFASTENSKRPYILRPLRVSQILEYVRMNSAALVEEAGFAVELQVQAGLPCVIGDLAALSQCLQNLLVNAVKYGGRDRWIGLSARIHEAGDYSNEIRISVRDHGVGISSSELPHIFEPFYRSPEVIAAQIHGTGLGLCLAKRIAETMGGSLSVISEVGVGSVFTLHLPVFGEKDAEPANRSSEADTVIPQ